MSETPQRSTGTGSTLSAAMFGALITVIALAGAFAIADTPRQITEVANAVVSAEGFEVIPPSFETAAENSAITPATGKYADPGLQVTFDVFG